MVKQISKFTVRTGKSGVYGDIYQTTFYTVFRVPNKNDPVQLTCLFPALHIAQHVSSCVHPQVFHITRLLDLLQSMVYDNQYPYLIFQSILDAVTSVAVY